MTLRISLSLCVGLYRVTPAADLTHVCIYIVLVFGSLSNFSLLLLLYLDDDKVIFLLRTNEWMLRSFFFLSFLLY